MRSLLFFCFISLSTAVFDAQKCLAGFQGIADILTLNQKTTRAICTDKSKIAENSALILTVLDSCGLKDWRTEMNKKDRQLGAIVEGFVDYFVEFLCVKKDDHYCFPAAVRMLDLSYFIPLFGEAEFNITKLDLKCYAMGKQTLKLICPAGDKNTGIIGQKKCQGAMVQYFDKAIWMIHSLLGNFAPDEVKETMKPLLKFAIDVRNLCRAGARGKARKLMKRVCVKGTTEEEEEEPTTPTPCLEEDSIADDCLVKEICTQDEEDACNTIESNTLQVLAAQKSYQGSLGQPQFTLRDGSQLTLDRAKKICKIKTGCTKKVKRTVDIEIFREGIDLYKKYQDSDPETKKKWAESFCLDQQVKEGGFFIDECKVMFNEGRVGSEVTMNNRRLLDSTKTIVASVTAETEKTKAFTCEDTGSFFSFDNVLNSNSANSTGVSVQAACTCSDSSCLDPAEGTPAPTSQSPQPVDNGAVQLSTSLIAIVSFVFTIYNM